MALAIEVLIETDAKIKNAWLLTMPRSVTLSRRAREDLVKSKCIKEVRVDDTTLLITPERGKEKLAMLELMHIISSNIVVNPKRKDLKLQQLVDEARYRWYDEG